MENDNKMKEQLMIAIREINKANKGTINILRNTEVNNVRMIERNSKNVKDPNPLMSAMSNMSKKYPISINKEKASKYGVPSMLLGPMDTHLHERISAKKESIDWWIKNAKVPREELLEVINVVCRKHAKSVSDYYDIDWSNTEFQFGRVELERVRSRIQTPLMEIPHSLRDEALIQAFLPDSTIHREYIENEILQTLKDKMGEMTAPTMNWASQLRILKSQLDPKVRCLPSFSGISEDLVELKHALLHQNFRVKRMPQHVVSIGRKGLKLVAQTICQQIIR